LDLPVPGARTIDRQAVDDAGREHVTLMHSGSDDLRRNPPRASPINTKANSAGGCMTVQQATAARPYVLDAASASPQNLPQAPPATLPVVLTPVRVPAVTVARPGWRDYAVHGGLSLASVGGVGVLALAGGGTATLVGAALAAAVATGVGFARLVGAGNRVDQ